MFYNYFKIALRNLQRNLVFATLSSLGLGLSIACCVLIFLLVRHHLSIDQYHAKADRIQLITTESKGEVNHLEGNVPYPMGAALRQEFAFLEKTAMVSARQNTLITLNHTGEAPVKFKAENIRAFAEPEFFEIFDLPLVQGTMEAFQQPNTALITENIARKYFGSTDATGKTFRVNNNTNYQVVGVLHDLPENTDFRYEIYCSWATLTSDANAKRMLNNWGGIHGGTQCFTVLREGHFREELETAFSNFRERYFHPEVREFYYHAKPLATVHFDPDFGSGVRKSFIWALALIGILLLITACINFVNMATAQALSRAREVGVRKAIGSTRAELFWQFMSETGLIVLISTAIGLASAYLCLPRLNALINTHLSMPLLSDLVFYSFLVGLMLVVAFLSGAYPSLVLSRFRPVESLKGAVEGQNSGKISLRRLLICAQFTVSQVLIIGAVTITAQLDYTRRADLGFQHEDIVLIPIPGQNEPTKQNTIRQQFQQISGVESVSFCFQPPASDENWGSRIRLEGRTENENWEVNMKSQDDRYLETFDIKLVAGRNLEPSDTTRELLVNEEMVRKLGFTSPEEILGKKLYEGKDRGFPVVGVVKDFHNRSFHEAIIPQIMMANADRYDNCAVRLNLQNQKQALAEIQKIWLAHFPEYYFESVFMDTRLAKFYEQEGILLQLIRLFAGIAVFVGCLGLYGLAAFLITRKRKEIGIRKTLGAGISSILWQFGKEYTRLIVLAFVLAGPLAWWAMEAWLKEYAYRISMSTGIFMVSLLATFGVAVLTVGFQSVKAALANPVKSLRSE